MTQPAPALTIRKLDVAYGDFLAVQGIDLDIAQHGLTALVGSSGCGKTTLLRTIAGFEVPQKGTISLCGETVCGPGHWVAPEKRRIGMVFQQGALFPHMTVLQNVLYGLSRGPESRRRAQETLDLVKISHRAQHFPDQLSGGEQQRVALARALAPQPRLILLDEPFANLDAGLRRSLREEVRTILRRAQMTAILVTHDQEEALSIADRVAVMAQGQLLQVGSPEEIYRHPQSPEVARFIGDGQLLECQVAQGMATCDFGQVACSGDDGPGLLLIRPEDFSFVATETDQDQASTLSGRIRARHFFGHDLIDEVELQDGRVLQVRSHDAASRRIGDPVALQLCSKKEFHVLQT